jgi:uncharacterized membrane protein
MDDFTQIDILAVLWFLLCWIGFVLFADRSRFSTRSMNRTMNGYRQRWMEEMLKRENRVVDTQIIGNQLNGAAFFASTMILLVGGLFALLGATDKAITVFEALHFIETPTLLAWEVKILLLIIIFIYGFFKFAWSFRIFNFCSVLIGAAPTDWQNDPDAQAAVRRAAEINNLGARHFNNGLRALFFGQAALGWFLHPFLFMAASVWVVFVLYRREFRSRSLKVVRGSS